MKDNDIWLRIKAAEIVATYFDSTDSIEIFVITQIKYISSLKMEVSNYEQTNI